MRIHSRIVIGSMVGLGFVMIGIVGLHLGGESVLKVGVYSQLLGAFIGGFLTLLSANTSWLSGEVAALWPKRERLGWTLIGCGCIMWGIGEGFGGITLLSVKIPFLPWRISAMPVFLLSCCWASSCPFPGSEVSVCWFCLTV